MTRQESLWGIAGVLALMLIALVTWSRYEDARNRWQMADLSVRDTRRMASTIASRGSASEGEADILDGIRRTMAAAGMPLEKLDGVTNRGGGAGESMQAEVGFAGVTPEQLAAWHACWRSDPAASWALSTCHLRPSRTGDDPSRVALDATLLFARGR